MIRLPDEGGVVKPASAAYLPWMSSLKVQYLFLYLFSMRNALLLAKSSNWIRQFIPYLQCDDNNRSDGASPQRSFLCSFSNVSTHLSVTACINSSISSSYSFPRILLCFSPMYSGSLSSAWITQLKIMIKKLFGFWSWSYLWISKWLHRHISNLLNLSDMDSMTPDKSADKQRCNSS